MASASLRSRSSTDLTAAEKATKLLTRRAPRTRQKDLIGAWVLAAFERLVSEGMTLTLATDEVARRGGNKTPTIENWRNELKRDSARLYPLPRGQHLQRLRFRVQVCMNYAAVHGLTGAQMLDLIESDPALVHGLSARRANNQA